MLTPILPQDAHNFVGKYMEVRSHFNFVMDLEKSHGHYIVDSREFTYDDNNLKKLTLEERTYLDMYTQFASWPIAYNHPELMDDNFLKTLSRVSVNKIASSDIITVEKTAYVKLMSELAMTDGLDYMFLISGGALAVENALKASFDWKIRKNFARGILLPETDYKIAHFKEAFHGRTGYTMSLTNTDIEKTKFFPKFESWPRLTNPKITFPIEKHLAEIERLEKQSLAELEESIRQNPHSIAALIIETVQGEGGDNHFRPEFFASLRKITEEHDILLILDEVQAGCGLTGKFWAYQHTGIVPDILCFGKKMQVCGILASRSKFNQVENHVFKATSRLNSTWGADLTDMVRASRLLYLIQKNDLVNNAAQMGDYFLKELQNLETEFRGLIHNARGMGLMCAFDFYTPKFRAEFVSEMTKRRVLTLTCGARSIRLRPMLDVKKEHIGQYVVAARDSLHHILKNSAK